jgi:hypothetical protein
MSEDDYREKTVREFLDMIKEPIVREEIRAGLVESLKLDGYTED